VNVKNYFPDVDRVLSKLKQYVRFFEEKKGKEIDEDEAKENLNEVDEFIEAIQKYLDSVCNDENRIEKFKRQRDSVEEIQQYIEELDNKRTRYHSSIISSMIRIDRIATRNGIAKVFDYAEEFEKEYSALIPNTIEGKQKMTERERIKRRELGNFGLYIAASVTVGLEMSDKEMRDFASCEEEITDEEKSMNVRRAFQMVKSSSKIAHVSRNMNDMLRWVDITTKIWYNSKGYFGLMRKESSSWMKK